MKKLGRLNWILAGAISLATLAGCRGLPTKEERAARRDFAAVAKDFRPDGQRPPLPEWHPESGLGNYLWFALRNEPSVEAAYFDWAASVERITVARSLPDPQLTFESDIADAVMTVMPGFMQEFPGPGKLKAAARVASAESQVKYFGFESAVLQTAYDLKRTYYTLLLLDERLRLNRETLQWLGDVASLARAQNQVGQVSLSDVYRAEIERDQLATDLANLEDSRVPLFAQFKAALGLSRTQADPPLPAAGAATRLDLTPDELRATGFARNPRLRAMAAEVRRAEAELAEAAKSKIPDFSLGLMTDVRPSPVMFRPLAQMSLPIWRDKIAAKIAGAQAGRRAAAARLTAEEILFAVDFALKTYDYREVTRNLVLLQTGIIPQTWQSLELARAQYRTGQIDFFMRVTAERAWLNCQLTEVEARTRREIVLAELSLLIAGVPPSGAPGLAAPPDVASPSPQHSQKAPP